MKKLLLIVVALFMFGFVQAHSGDGLFIADHSGDGSYLTDHSGDGLLIADHQGSDSFKMPLAVNHQGDGM